jgi:phage pi2 protein 07
MRSDQLSTISRQESLAVDESYNSLQDCGIAEGFLIEDIKIKLKIKNELCVCEMLLLPRLSRGLTADA